MREYLKNIRINKKATQKETAEALNISQNYYSQIENGTKAKNISLGLLIKIATYFEVDLGYLIEQERAISDKKGA